MRTPTVAALFVRLPAASVEPLEPVAENIWAHTPDGDLLIHSAPFGGPGFQVAPIETDLGVPFQITIPRSVAPAVDVTYELVARRPDGTTISLTAQVPVSLVESLPAVVPPDSSDLATETLDESRVLLQAAFLSTITKLQIPLAALPPKQRTQLYGTLKAQALDAQVEVSP